MRLGQLCAWITLFLVIGTAIVVVLRYGFAIGAIALQEAVMYGHALVFMGAAAWTLQRNGHVRVDIFYQKFSSRRQATVDLPRPSAVPAAGMSVHRLEQLGLRQQLLGDARGLERVRRAEVRLPAEEHHPPAGRQPDAAGTRIWSRWPIASRVACRSRR